MPDAEIYMAVTDYIDFPAPQVPTPVRAHATARAGHPIIQRTPHMWIPLQIDYEVEQSKTETPKRASAKISNG